MVDRKLSGKNLAEHEDKRDVWQEVLDSVDEIKAGGGKRHKHGLIQGSHTDKSSELPGVSKSVALTHA